MLMLLRLMIQWKIVKTMMIDTTDILIISRVNVYFHGGYRVSTCMSILEYL